MRKYTVEDVVQEFEKSGELIYQANLSGDYKTNNREWERLTKHYRAFEKDLELGHCCIDRLIESSNVVVKTYAAAYCLALSYNVERAVSVLEEIASDPGNGIFRLDAEMTLKVWRKQGYLKIYQ